MKKMIVAALWLTFCAVGASAQYFCTDKGKVMYYKAVNSHEKESVETVIKSTITEVNTAEDGQITARVENIQSDANDPFAEMKTYGSFEYDPKTDVTKVIAMSGEDFKKMIITVIKESALAAGQHMSDMELDDLEKVMSAKGAIEFSIDPKAAVGSKIPNATLRLNAGQINMTMNLWDGKFLGMESVTTEAGTYDCAKVSYVLRTSTPGGNEKKIMTEWYAKGVGLVRSIETDKKGNILEEETLRVIK